MKLSFLEDSSLTKKIHISKKKGEVFIPETEKVYVIITGTVAETLEKNDGLETHIKRLLGPGDIFPLYIPHTSSDLSELIYERRVPGKIIEIAQEDFTNLLYTNQQITQLYMGYIGEAIQGVEQRLEDQNFLSTTDRCIQLLVKLAENNQFSRDFDGQKEIRCGLTQLQLASLAGCSRQSFTQTMNRLKNNNLLIYDAKRIFIYNIDALKAYKK